MIDSSNLIIPCRMISALAFALFLHGSILAQTAPLISVDRIIGERQAGGNALGFDQDTDANQVGTSGSAGSRVDANLILGFALPTLSPGETVESVQLRFGIKAAFDQAGAGLPDLHLSLLSAANPAASGTTLFHHGPAQTNDAAAFAGATTVRVEGTDQNSFPDDREDRTLVLTGAALNLFQSFYGDDHLPDRPEAFFRFNLSKNPDEKRYLIRYVIDIAADQASLVINGARITYLDATAGPGGNTFATNRPTNDYSWVGPKASTANNTQWNRREDIEANGTGLFQALPNGDPSGIPELTTMITNLADGTYAIYAFFWDEVVSDSQNWLLSAGLRSGELTTYQAPFGPAVFGATNEGVTNAQDLPFTTPVITRSSDGERNLFGISLGKTTVRGGSAVPVFIDLNLPASIVSTRAWFDGVGSAPAAPISKKPPPEITRITPLGEGRWEIALKGEPFARYELLVSENLSFNLGKQVELLLPTGVGRVGGLKNQLITTDANGLATVQMDLESLPVQFIRAQTSP